MAERTIDDVLSGKVQRVRIVYDAGEVGLNHAHATVQLEGEDNNEMFQGDDVLKVAGFVSGLTLKDAPTT